VRGAEPGWTVEAVRGLGTMTDVETAGAILGIGRSKAYELAKDKKFPVRIVRVGRRYLVPVCTRYLVPVHPLLVLLGVEPEPGPVQ
jgi:hypothetical protein